MRKQRRGGVPLYIHCKSVEFKIRNDVSINSDDLEPISVEILFENRKNTIFNALYRQPKGQIEQFEKFLKETFSLIKNSKKQFHVAGDFHLNVADHGICKFYSCTTIFKYNLRKRHISHK